MPILVSSLLVDSSDVPLFLRIGQRGITVVPDSSRSIWLRCRLFSPHRFAHMGKRKDKDKHSAQPAAECEQELSGGGEFDNEFEDDEVMETSDEHLFAAAVALLPSAQQNLLASLSPADLATQLATLAVVPPAPASQQTLVADEILARLAQQQELIDSLQLKIQGRTQSSSSGKRIVGRPPPPWSPDEESFAEWYEQHCPLFFSLNDINEKKAALALNYAGKHATSEFRRVRDTLPADADLTVMDLDRAFNLTLCRRTQLQRRLDLLAMRFREGKVKGGSAATDLTTHVQRFTSKADACSTLDELTKIALLHNSLPADLQRVVITQPNAQEWLDFGAYSHFVILKGDELQRERLASAPRDGEWVRIVKRARKFPPPSHPSGAGPSSAGGAGPSTSAGPPTGPRQPKPFDARGKLDAAAYQQAFGRDNPRCSNCNAPWDTPRHRCSNAHCIKGKGKGPASKKVGWGVSGVGCVGRSGFREC